MPRSETSPAPVRLHITGTFDMSAARTLCDELIGASRTPFVVDLTLARELHDCALAHLFSAVELLRGRVQLRGLSRRHARLVAYLASADAGGAAAATSAS